MSVEKGKEAIHLQPDDDIVAGHIHIGDELLKGEDNDQGFEVFQNTGDGVDFRVLSWQWASIIFLKCK